MGCKNKKKRGKKILFALLSALLLCSHVAFAEEITLDTQKVTVKNSYLTGVMVDNTNAKIQEVTITKSFLVFVKVKVYPSAIQEAK